MTIYTSKQWLLKEQPGDKFDPKDTFELSEKTYSSDDVKDKQILIKAKYLSNDPAQRTWISSHYPEGRLYRKPIEPGSIMDAGGIFQVVESKSEKYKTGDLVQASGGWTQYRIIDESAVLQRIQIDPTDALALGLTALTAYFGLLKVGEATSKDTTIVISGAAGATGSNVAQFAKNVLGIKNVIGFAGSDEKCTLLKEKCGCDVALNYKSKTFKEDFEKATEGFVDVYFDNVGGEVLDMVLRRMKDYGRVVACGSISGYDDASVPVIGTKAWAQVIFSKLKLQGFICSDYASEFGQAVKEMQGWVKEGKFKPIKTVWEAKFEEVPQGMTKLLKGDNTGKLITKLVD